MASQRPKSSEARERLLETADRLFYAEGVRAVGIDRVIAEAGVAKMTLYAHFPSKDDLIVAALRYREEQVGAFFEAAMARHAGPGRDALAVFFAALKDWFRSPDFRGCAFQNAAIELADRDHAGSRFAREHKLRFAGQLKEFVGASAGEVGAGAVPAIVLLVEGAIMTALMHGDADAADVARDAAVALVGAKSVAKPSGGRKAARKVSA